MIEYRIKEIEPSLFVVERRHTGFWRFLGWWAFTAQETETGFDREQFSNVGAAEQFIAKKRAERARKVIIRREYPLIRKYPA